VSTGSSNVHGKSILNKIGYLEKSKYFLNDGVPKEKLDMDLIIRQEMK
jgi:hypothetical protein